MCPKRSLAWRSAFMRADPPALDGGAGSIAPARGRVRRPLSDDQRPAVELVPAQDVVLVQVAEELDFELAAGLGVLGDDLGQVALRGDAESAPAGARGDLGGAEDVARLQRELRRG